MTAVPLLATPARPILPDMTGVIVRRIAELRNRMVATSGSDLLLPVIVVGSAAGAVGSLSNPVVSPNPAVVGTTVTFTVTYTDAGGVAPQRASTP